MIRDYKEDGKIFFVLARPDQCPRGKAFCELKKWKTGAPSVFLELLPESAGNPGNPFQRLNSLIACQQDARESVELLACDAGESVVERSERDEIIDGQSDIRLQGIETFLGLVVERRLRVLFFETS